MPDTLASGRCKPVPKRRPPAQEGGVRGAPTAANRRRRTAIGCRAARERRPSGQPARVAPREDRPLAGMARQAGEQPGRELASTRPPGGGRAGVEPTGIGERAEQLQRVNGGTLPLSSSANASSTRAASTRPRPVPGDRCRQQQRPDLRRGTERETWIAFSSKPGTAGATQPQLERLQVVSSSGEVSTITSPGLQRRGRGAEIAAQQRQQARLRVDLHPQALDLGGGGRGPRPLEQRRRSGDVAEQQRQLGGHQPAGALAMCIAGAFGLAHEVGPGVQRAAESPAM